MPLKTKRWNDRLNASDGRRILVCRYRPRGVRKEDETWDEWRPELGPSRALHADFYGKTGAPLTWTEFRRRYIDEMKAQKELILELAGRIASGDTITLLCSSACVDAARCHRTLLQGIIEKELAARRRPRQRRRST